MADYTVNVNEVAGALAEGVPLTCPKCGAPLHLGVTTTRGMPEWVIGHVTRGCGFILMQEDAGLLLERYTSLRKTL